ncbi:MAG: hypothetical protein HOL58_04880 [Francisellaceae bacterium]|nr:hypothetical protein [Francisellaceae bacterium]
MVGYTTLSIGENESTENIAVRVELVDSFSDFYNKYNGENESSLKDIYWEFLCQWYRRDSVINRRFLLNQTTTGKEVKYRGKLLSKASDEDITWHLAEEIAIACLDRVKKLDRGTLLRNEAFKSVLFAIEASGVNEQLVVKLGNDIIGYIKSLGAEEFNKPYGCSHLTILDTYLQYLMENPSQINVSFVSNLIQSGARSSEGE